MLRWFILIFALLCLLFFGLMGSRSPNRRFATRPVEVFQDMDHQYKVRFQQPSDFFPDGQASRKPVAGTIPMGHEMLRTKAEADAAPEPGGYFMTGLIGDYFGEGFPEGITVNQPLLARGKERFAIFCSPCHGLSGDGKGIVGQYWLGSTLPPTANLVDGRVSAYPEGRIFYTMGHGQGLMGPYGGNVPVPDRWAIVAFVRALQKSQVSDGNDPKVKEAFERGQPPKPAAQPQAAAAGALK
jgi:mono/diheme cytochrome c family protein